MARPRKEVDWADIEKLCGLQCTEEEIAQFCEVSVDTLSRRCQEEHGVSFAEYFAQKRGVGRISLRRSQWQLAHKGNATMLIWLGKQYLSQRDRSRDEVEEEAKGKESARLTSASEIAKAILLAKQGKQDDESQG